METARPASMLELTDDELVLRVRKGELALFEALMRRHNARVYRAARAILRDDEEAEDVMQDAFVRAYEHLHEFEGRARFSTWLTRIAVHEALKRARRGKRLTPLDEKLEESTMSTRSEDGPEQQLSDSELRDRLEGAVAALPDEFRSVFILRAIEGLSGAETAECLGVPEETVKTRLHRARARLQQSVRRDFEACLPQLYPFHLSRCDRVVHAVMRRIGAEGEGSDKGGKRVPRV